ncbi:hypothetical protein NKK48_19885 [Mesorhizobium sp. C386A]|uniref:hypothetical protein n=1 Tax=unclassified Mesorhizobium TaxID=325217 RepID=UPI0003CEA885|nr:MULTISPECIES: hypothetical protein [unclassified Mesorhizobium]ESY11306.1 hypothetical protein X752_07705 [Mesorhizobium sp. LNJC398B00]ESY30856.1 hypothetical protein X748_26095 [Mesorhizobium sp. LNJC386A00]
MASIFGFRSRDPARDKQTDLARFDRLAKLLDQITAEIAAEKTGLEARYRSKSTNAAFLVESMENGSASASKLSEVGELTKSILNCEQRIAELVRQTSRMKELRHSLDAIVGEDGQSSDSHGEYVKSAGRFG